MTWRDVEVVRDPAGRPDLRLHGETAGRVARAGLRPASVSLSHTAELAIAVVILTR